MTRKEKGKERCMFTSVENKGTTPRLMQLRILRGKPNQAGVFLVLYQTFVQYPCVESDGKQKKKKNRGGTCESL